MPHFSTDTYVAVLALAISAIALWLALKTDRELRVVSAATADISKNLTTRYIGEFPSYLPDIVDVLGAADHNILIATDLPGYASYTNHDAYLDYKAAIDKRQGTRVEITMMVLDEPLRKSILDI